MAELKIEKLPASRRGMAEMKITGFKDGELNELKSMEHHEAEEKLIDMLDYRNGNQGTCWAQGYGIYGVWFDNEAAYMNVGCSCD